MKSIILFNLWVMVLFKILDIITTIVGIEYFGLIETNPVGYRNVIIYSLITLNLITIGTFYIRNIRDVVFDNKIFIVIFLYIFIVNFILLFTIIGNILHMFNILGYVSTIDIYHIYN